MNHENIDYDSIMEDMFKGDMVTPDKIYMDLFILKDLDIGAIFSLAQDKNETSSIEEIIRTNLKKYEKRYFLDPVHYLKVPYEREEINRRLQDMKYSSDVFFLSPVTNGIDLILKHLLLQANHASVLEKEGDVTVDLNTWPLKLDEKINYDISSFLGEIFKTNMRTFSESLKDMPLERWKSYDEMYVYHFKEFSENKNLMKSISDFAFFRKRLFAVPCCGYEYKKRPENKYHEELLCVQSQYAMAMPNFKHLPMPLISPKLHQGQGP